MAFGKKPSAGAAPASPPSAKPSASGPAPLGEGDPPPPDVLAAKLLAWFEEAFANERGAHIETLLTVLGAMAGFGCQVSIREAMIGGAMPAGTLKEITTVDGGKYYFGDMLNEPLITAQVSVWQLVGGGAQHAGARQLPDINEIGGFVAGSIGSPAFGTLRVPPEHRPAMTPLQALQGNWVTAYKFIRFFNGARMATGWYFAMAAQQLIIKGKDIIDPALACRIVMESAVAMAKIDPASIGYDPREGLTWKVRSQSS